MGFFKSLIKELIDEGNTVDIATNTDIKDVPDFYKDLNCKVYKLSCQRTPFSFKNIKVIKEIKEIVNNNNYDIVHCHTPIVSLYTKLACKKYRKQGGKVVYTCHGFHFHKKSSFKDWMLYYPAEKCSAHLCDMIITICKEDFNIANKMKVKSVKYIPGVGIDVNKIEKITINRNEELQKLSLPKDAFIIASTGELSKRKNFSVIIKAIAQLKNNNIYYLICGEGNKRHELSKLAVDLNVSKNVIFLGHIQHDEVIKICHLADIGAIPSLIEGLGLAGLEYMASGKPIIGSNVHGINDYLINGKTGISCEPKNIDAFAKAIMLLKDDKEFYMQCSENAKNMSLNFDYKISNDIMKNIYKEVVNENQR